MLQGGTAIPSGADMNDYSTPGNYYCASSVTVPTLINAPFSSVFTMKVVYGNGTGYPSQKYEELLTGRKAYRSYISESGGWQPYNYFSNDTTVLATAQKSSPPIRTFNNEEDIDNYLDNFSNSFAGNVHYYTAISLTIMHSQLGGGAHLIEGYKTSNSYEWQQATTYSSPNGCYRRARSKAGGVWGEWVLFKNS